MFGFFHHSNKNSPKYGVLKATEDTNMNTNQKIDVAVAYGCTWVRIGINVFGAPPNIEAGGWDGKSAAYEYAISRGLKVLPNIRAFPPGGTRPFVVEADIPLYVNIVYDILTECNQLTDIIVDNEPQTDKYWGDAPISDYVRMVQSIYAMAHPRRVRVYDGGLIDGQGFHMRVYAWANTKYGLAIADVYAASTGMSPAQKQYALTGDIADEDQEAGFKKEVDDVDLLLSMRNHVDAFNLHFYESPSLPSTTTIATHALRFGKEYIVATTGKNVISNENGMRETENPTLATNMYNEFNRLRFDHIQLWDGDAEGEGERAKSFSNQTMPIFLKPNGEAYKAHILLHTRSKGSLA